MKSSRSALLPWWLAAGVAAAYAIALYAVLRHDLISNPQYDNHVIWYAADFVLALQDHTLGDFLLEVRKYPSAYTIPFALTMLLMVQMYGSIKQSAIYLMGREITLGFGLGALGILARLSRKLTGTCAAVLLLASSILWFQFSTAIRPHVPVAFWTLVAFAAAVHLRERRTVLRIVAAFGAAAIAAATLQSGFLAFVFPLWGMLGNRPSRNDILRTILPLGIAGLAALVLGYPFLLSGLLGSQAAHVGVDLGHDVGLTFDLPHLVRIMGTLVIMEPVLALFAGWGIVRIVRKRDVLPPEWIPVIVYLAIFFLLFGLQSISSPRFFLPTLPFLALLGAQAFRHAPCMVRIGTAGVIVLVCIRLTMLAVVPNTFQQAGRDARAFNGPVGFLGAPSYFYSIQPDKVSDGDPIPGMVLSTENVSPNLPGEWLLCQRYESGALGNDIVLLWGDAPLTWWYVFTAASMGPRVRAYCLQGAGLPEAS